MQSLDAYRSFFKSAIYGCNLMSDESSAKVIHICFSKLQDRNPEAISRILSEYSTAAARAVSYTHLTLPTMPDV